MNAPAGASSRIRATSPALDANDSALIYSEPSTDRDRGLVFRRQCRKPRWRVDVDRSVRPHPTSVDHLRFRSIRPYARYSEQRPVEVDRDAIAHIERLEDRGRPEHQPLRGSLDAVGSQTHATPVFSSTPSAMGPHRTCAPSVSRQIGVDECCRTRAIRHSTSSTAVCDRLMRKRSTRRWSSPRMISGRSDDGPSVHKILIFICLLDSFWAVPVASKIGAAQQRPSLSEDKLEPPPRDL